jgi:hypothetical protein
MQPPNRKTTMSFKRTVYLTNIRLAWVADAPTIPYLLAELEGQPIHFPYEQNPGPHRDGVLVYHPIAFSNGYPTPPAVIRKAGGQTNRIEGGLRSRALVALYDQMIAETDSGSLKPGDERVFAASLRIEVGG